MLSASVTTPSGSETQARTRLPGGRLAPVEPDDLRRASADVEEHRALGCRVEQREASLRGELRFGAPVDDFKLKAEFVATRSRKSAPFSAIRQAWVAIGARPPRAHASFCAQMRRAPIARSMASASSSPVCATPSPSRTMREKESTTRNPLGPASQQAAGNCWCRDQARLERPTLPPAASTPAASCGAGPTTPVIAIVARSAGPIDSRRG